MEFKNEFNEQKILKKVVGNCLENSKEGNIVNLFLKTNNIEQISNYIATIIKDNSWELNFSFQEEEIKKDFFQLPYTPFLEIIKKHLKQNNLNVEQVVENSGVYYFHREFFIDYLSQNNNFSKIKEFIGSLDDSLEYEKTEIYNSILRLFNYLFQTNHQIYIIKNFNYIKKSTIKFLNYVLENNPKAKVSFMYLFDDEDFAFFNSDFNNKANYYYDFLEKIFEHEFYLEINSSNQQSKNQSVKDYQKGIIDSKKINSIINLSRISFNFLAIEEVKNQTKKIYDCILNNQIKIKSKNYYTLLILLGDSHFLLKESDLALDYYNRFLEFAIKNNNKEKISLAYIKLSMINQKRHDIDVGKKYALQALKLAKELKNDNLLLKAYDVFYGILVLLRSTRDDFNVEGKYYEVFSKFEKLLKKNNCYNLLMGIYGTHSSDHSLSLEDKLKYCKKGIEIAKKFKNKHKLASLYHNLGMVYSLIGNNEKTFAAYNKSEKLKLEIGNVLEIIRIYNGTGYAYFSNEKYKQAIEYYNKALPYLKEISSYKEIGTVFFNIALTYTFAQKYKNAIQFFEKTLTLLEVLDLNSIPFHTKHGIYALITFCYLKDDNIIKAKRYMNKVNKFTNEYNHEEFYYYKLAHVSFLKEKHNYKAVKNIFSTILQKDVKQEHKFIIPKFIYEYVLFLKEREEYNEAKKIINQGISLCTELNYSFQKKLFEFELENINNNSDLEVNLKIKEIEFDINSIIEYIKQEAIMNDLYQKINEINFLNSLQKIFLKSKKSTIDIINEICNLINMTFTIDFIVFFTNENNCLKEICSINQINKEEIKLVINDVFNREETFIPQVKDNSKLKSLSVDFNSIINLPLISNDGLIANVFIANEQGQIALDENIFRIMSIASKQIAVALSNKQLTEKIKSKNNELEFINNNLKNLMNNIDQGILSFGSDLLINQQYSQECKNIFNFDIHNRKFSEIINIPVEEQELIDDILKALLELDINNDNLKAKAYIGLLPEEIEVYGQNIKADYKLFSANQDNKILVILTNITEKLNLEAKMEAERINLKMVVKVINSENDFKKRIENYNKFVKQKMYYLVNEAKNNKDALHKIYRKIHTFKGDFSQWYMSNTVDNLHQIENKISELLTQAQELSKQEIKDKLISFNLSELLKADLNIIVQNLGEEFFEKSERIVISKEKLLEFEEKIRNLFSALKGKTLLEEIRQWWYKPFSQFLINYSQYTVELANRLGKKIKEVEVISDDILVNEEVYYDFCNSLVNIFRNIVDHGIETPDKRISQGKDEAGEIKCSIKENGFNISIAISDDGQGIDIEKMKEKAIANKIYSQTELENIKQEKLLENLIFCDNLSSKDEITDLSGRGMGLPAVKKEVEKLNGEIKVRSKKNKGTNFMIELPYQEKIFSIEKDMKIIAKLLSPKFKDYFQQNFNLSLEDKAKKINYSFESSLYDLTSSLKLIGERSYRVIFSIDYHLAELITQRTVFDELLEEEKLELVKDMSKEILNTVVGNLSQKLIDKQIPSQLSTPKLISEKEVFDLSIKKVGKKREVKNLITFFETYKGNLTVSIIPEN